MRANQSSSPVVYGCTVLKLFDTSLTGRMPLSCLLLQFSLLAVGTVKGDCTRARSWGRCRSTPRLHLLVLPRKPSS